MNDKETVIWYIFKKPKKFSMKNKMTINEMILCKQIESRYLTPFL